MEAGGGKKEKAEEKQSKLKGRQCNAEGKGR